QRIERAREVRGETRRVDLVVAHDAVKIAVLALQDLEQPVRHFDVRVAAQLAEHGRGLDGLVAERIQLAEQSGPADLRHDSSLPLSFVYCTLYCTLIAPSLHP